MHVARTERIITQILRQPERFDMSAWVGGDGIEEVWVSGHDDADPRAGEYRQIVVDDGCGTTCCIAGWAVFNDKLEQAGGDFREAIEALVQQDYASETATPERAAELLELPSRGSDRASELPLFYRTNWPSYYNHDERDFDDTGEIAEAICAAELLRDMLDRKVVVRVGDPFEPWWAQFTDNI